MLIVPLIFCSFFAAAAEPDSLRMELGRHIGAARLPYLAQLCGTKWRALLTPDESRTFAAEILHLAPATRDSAAWVTGCLCAANNEIKASDLEKGKKWLEKAQILAAHSPARQIEVYSQWADFYTETGKLDSAIGYLFHAVDLCRTANLNSLKVSLWAMAAKANSSLGRVTTADSLCRLAFSICETTRDSASVLRRFGGIQKDLGRPDAAFRAFLRAYELEKNLGDDMMAAFNLHQTATILRDQGRFDQAIAQFEEVVRLSEKLHYSTMLARTHNSLGSLYFLKKNYEKALENYRRALALKQESGSPKKILNTISNMAELFALTERFDSCLALCETHLPMAKRIKYAQIETNLAFLGAFSAAKLGQNRKARDFLALGELAIKKVNVREELPSVFQFAAQSHALLGNFESAFRYQNLFQNAQDSIFNVEKSRIVAEVETRFETEKKEQQIAALGQENELKTARIAADRLRQLALLGFLALAAALVIALFRSAKIRQKHNAALAETNRALNQKNKEVQTLLREIHHRVKNNLQIVSSLLSLQARRIDDPGALDALRTSQARVRSMGLLHQRLYQGEQLKNIPMRPYLTDLAASLFDAYGFDEDNERVQLKTDLADLAFDVDVAVPIGLIANELLTNALKHAFPDDKAGEIGLFLYKIGDNGFRLEVHDNGIGMPFLDGKPATAPTSFGFELVESLAQKMGGRLQYFTEKGACAILEVEKS